MASRYNSDDFETYRNIKFLRHEPGNNSVVGQLYFQKKKKKLIQKKRSDLWLQEVGVDGEGIGWREPKDTKFPLKINEY